MCDFFKHLQVYFVAVKPAPYLIPDSNQGYKNICAAVKKKKSVGTLQKKQNKTEIQSQKSLSKNTQQNQKSFFVAYSFKSWEKIKKVVQFTNHSHFHSQTT